MRKIIFVLVLVMGGIPFYVAGQDLSHKGKSFWIAYPDPIQTVRMILYVGAGNRPATVTITATWETGSLQKVYNVPANTVISSDLMPQNLLLADQVNREKTFARNVHIESDVPIVAYVHYYNSEYSGGSLLIPEETWGYSYTAMDAPGDQNGFICVIAGHDNTSVEITPAVSSSLGKPANTPFTVTLNRGQVYQLVSGGGELTGSKIRSVANAAGGCYPVSVLSGSLGTPICGMTSDYIINQLFPEQSWGKHFVTAPFSSSVSNGNTFNPGIFRVQLSDPNTVVKLNGNVLTGAVNNLYYEFSSNTADYIEADKPIMVVQFMGSQSLQGGNCQFYGVGDPEMISLSPLEQATSRSDFYLSFQGGITYNFLTLVIPTGGLPSLKIDGSSNFSYVFAHPNLPGYTVVVNRWIAAGKSCTVTSDSAFTGITYGLAPWNTYGFNITSLKNLAGTVLLSNKPDAGLLKDSTCAGMMCKLVYKTGYQPTRIEWQLNNLPGISPGANVVVNNPVPDSTVVEYGNIYYVYSTPSYYVFNTPGIVTVPVVVTTPAIGNCDNTQTFTGYLTVKASPSAAFTVDPPVICMPGGKASFTNQSSFPQAGTALQYQWSFGDGGSSTLANPAHDYASPVTLPVSLAVSAPNGCSDTAYQILVFANRPKAGFTVSDDTVCANTPVVFTDKSIAAPGSNISSWQWEFGDGSVYNQSAPVKSYPRAGSYTVQQYVKSNQGCGSDTAVQKIEVYAVPRVDAGPDIIMQQGGSTTLQGMADAGAAVQWSPATWLDNPASLSPTAAPPADQWYYLIAVSGNRCTAYDSVWIKVLLTLNIPNAFSPNGDGINDVWEIPGLNSYPAATLQVFNRWGQKVFESKGYARPWDGRVGGQPLPVATYYYVLDPGYKKPRQSGTVTILR